MQNVGRVKSSVDDLTMERGTVRMRVAFVLRSAEVQPLFRDLCDGACVFTDALRPWPILPPTIKQPPSVLYHPLCQSAQKSDTSTKHIHHPRGGRVSSYVLLPGYF